ncbi:hypothetical protein LR48_Vigan05g043900 [Vigna angularis]|uniref:Reticulon-like protein n=1 Tax=Phaseolus angularis TaxID=3914 RepID=A0A0L9UIV2_PHAAN|nr:Reticulon-like protein [Vigna angularis]KOM42835.1 hypothetical protein LR48_Vigan05g043900 [Vigna angularis]
MKSDEVGGGVKVFSAEQGSEEGGNGGTKLKSSQTGGVVATGKRKSWKLGRSEGLENKKIQIGRGKVEQCKNLNVSSDSIKKSPKQVRKEKNEGTGASVCTDKLERGPILTRRKRSEVGESGEKNIGQLRKNNGKNDSDENCKDFGVCQEKVISSRSDDASMVKCSPMHVDGGSHDDEEEDEEEVEMDDEELDIEMEIQSFDVKEINAPESKVVNKPEKEFMNVPEKQKTEKVVRTDRHFHQKHERLLSVPLTVIPSPPIKKLSTIHKNFSKADSTNFWIGRFHDAWDSCSHKKVVALAIFCLAWNLSSLVARIWSVFVLFVGFKYYQQHYLVRDERVEDEAGFGETWQEPVGVKAQNVKKGF